MNEEMLRRLNEEILNRSQTCERGILAMGMNELGMPIMAVLMVAPSCIEISRVIHFMPDGEPVFYDAVLN